MERERPAKAEALRIRLHAILHQNLSGLSGLVTRSKKCWQLGLRGERPVTLRDLSELATHGSREAKLAIYAIASALIEAVRPTDCTSISEAVAAYTRETSDVAPAYIRAASDGILTLEELAALRREVLEGRLRSEALIAEIDACERRLAS